MQLLTSTSKYPYFQILNPTISQLILKKKVSPQAEFSAYLLLCNKNGRNFAQKAEL